MPKEKKKADYVRRGFDIRRDLYEELRIDAIKKGVKTKDWLVTAIENQLQKGKKNVNRKGS
jgi:hypothetical protein